MQELAEEESSSDPEETPDPDLASERAKKQEIIANLKHLNLLGSQGEVGQTTPSEVGTSHKDYLLNQGTEGTINDKGTDDIKLTDQEAD